MENNVPRWQLVDGPTACEFARMAQRDIDARPAYSPTPTVVEVCDYVTQAALAFMSHYAHAEWGETHDWMEETERFYAARVAAFRPPWADDDALSDDESDDVDSAEAEWDALQLAEAFRRRGIPCTAYLSSIRIEWGPRSGDLVVHVSPYFTCDVCITTQDDTLDYLAQGMLMSDRDAIAQVVQDAIDAAQGGA